MLQLATADASSTPDRNDVGVYVVLVCSETTDIGISYGECGQKLLVCMSSCILNIVKLRTHLLVKLYHSSSLMNSRNLTNRH